MLDFLLNSDFLSALIAFALVLIPTIIIHELGHFLAAKMIGVNVLEFGIGFPPKLFRLFRWGETDFTLNLLPIGGFVRPLGEDMIGPVQEPEEQTDDIFDDEKPKNNPDVVYISEREELIARGVPEDKLMSVNDAKPLPRIFFMAAGALANFISAVVLFIIIALIGLPTIVGARIQVVDLPESSIFAGTAVEIGDAVEEIDGVNLSSPGDFIQQMLDRSGETVTLTMRSLESGEVYEVQVTPEANSARGVILVSAVAGNSPAEQAGLEAGDLLIAVDGLELGYETDPVIEIQEATQRAAGSSLELTVLRSGETLNLTLVPRVDPPAGEGPIGIAIRSQYILGDGIQFAEVDPVQELIPQSLGVSIEYGISRTLDVLNQIVTLPAQLINGTISPEEARPVSVVGISQVGGQFLQQSIRDGSPLMVFNFIALVSIFLGFTNLLPLPPLDGGRILFVLIEIVRGKPVSPRIEAMVYRIGIAFLLSLGLVIILYDLFNPFQLPQ